MIIHRSKYAHCEHTSSGNNGFINQGCITCHYSHT
uniref:Uncharacterized protein n=1 Tax=Anguilla anguilla TaxID=7936 RepID=A0A0E9T4T8_ANGAN